MFDFSLPLKIVKKRIKKSDNHARDNKCHCGKSYTTPSALTQHKKQKHFQENNA